MITNCDSVLGEKHESILDPLTEVLVVMGHLQQGASAMVIGVQPSEQIISCLCTTQYGCNVVLEDDTTS